MADQADALGGHHPLRSRAARIRRASDRLTAVDSITLSQVRAASEELAGMFEVAAEASGSNADCWPRELLTTALESDRMIGVLEALGGRRSRLPAAAFDGVLSDINRSGVRLKALYERPGIGRDTTSDRLAQLGGSALPYLEDAARARRSGNVFRVGAALALGSGLTLATASLSHDGDKWLAKSAPDLLIALTLVVVGGVLLRVSEKYRLHADENVRLARQLASVRAYVAALPLRAQALVLVALAPRLFPRVLEDTDPLREPIWPTTTELMAMLDPAASESSPPAEPPPGDRVVGSWIRRWCRPRAE